MFFSYLEMMSEIPVTVPEDPKLVAISSIPHFSLVELPLVIHIILYIYIYPPVN